MKLFNTLDVQLLNRTAQVARYWSNEELQRFSEIVTGDVANVSGWKDEDKQGRYYRDYFPRARSYTITNYYGESGFQGAPGEMLIDLNTPLLPEMHGKFDTVLCHTVLEHVFDVWTAFSNLSLLTRDLLIVVVPFCQIQHELASFGDYWRFTPTCLRELYTRNKFTVIYESSNEDFGCGNYVLFAGSRHPHLHTPRLGMFKPLGLQGKWISHHWMFRILPKLWLRKLRPHASSDVQRRK
jgi:hypothetical protein